MRICICCHRQERIAQQEFTCDNDDCVLGDVGDQLSDIVCGREAEAVYLCLSLYQEWCCLVVRSQVTFCHCALCFPQVCVLKCLSIVLATLTFTLRYATINTKSNVRDFYKYLQEREGLEEYILWFLANIMLEVALEQGCARVVNY